MTTLEKFNRKVIEAIHWLPYDEAINEETHLFGCVIKHKKRGLGRYIKFGKSVKNILFENELEPIYAIDIGGNSNVLGIPITIGRVMQAIQNNDNDYPIHFDFFFEKHGFLTITQAKGHPIINKIVDWKLTKDNGQDADSSDQSEETLLKILELLQ